MADWFPPQFTESNPDAYILASEKGFTNDQIAVQFLEHFIQHLDARP
jgi:hypothetical protein